MTPEQKAELRRQCKSDVDALHYRVIRARCGDDVDEDTIRASSERGYDALTAITDFLYAERLRVQPLIEAGENARKVLVEELGDIEIGDNEIGPPDYGENAAAAMAMNEAIAMIDSALTAYQNTER